MATTTIKCEHCSKEFIPARASRRYCSGTCSNRAEPRGQAVKKYDNTFYDRNKESIKAKLKYRYHTDTEYRNKVFARVAARKHANGNRQPCEVCGNTKADQHHDDYTKPTEYRWLCRKHHIQHHIEQYGSWGAGLTNKI